jgi:carbon storage regulator CsrA
MLVLSRKSGEALVIGDNVKVYVSRILGNRVTLAIEAPQDVHVVRGELEVSLDDLMGKSSGKKSRGTTEGDRFGGRRVGSQWSAAFVSWGRLHRFESWMSERS